MLDDLMNNLSKTVILGTAITVGGVTVYDEMTPPAATYFQEVQVAPNFIEPSKQTGFVKSEIIQESPLIQKGSVVVDLVAKGPPKQDDYPRSPSPNLDDEASNSDNNFGLVQVN